jgi:OCT family organic cation transporter-like MFS transporter 4/5
MYPLLENSPTSIAILKGQGNALANVCAQAASLFAPQIVYSKVIDPRMPFIVMAIVAFLAAILAIFLPETAGIKLPDSIMEAEVSFDYSFAF